MPTRIDKIKYVVVLIFLLTMISARDANALALNPGNGTAMAPAANEFVAYTSTTTITASGTMTIPLTWSSSGLPAGLTLTLSGVNNVNCKITGTPTVSGTNLPFTVTVTDSRPGWQGGARSDTHNYTITINPRCQISGGNTGSIYFSIDPTSAGPIFNTITQNVTFQCGPGTTYSYAILPAQPKLTGAKNTSGIPFTLSAGQGLAASGLNTTDNTLISLLTTTSRVLATDYKNAYAETDNSGNITVTISWTGAGAGSITATVTATGTVLSACSVTGSSTLNFGSLNAVTNAGGATATVTPPSIMCTMGSPVSVTSDGGQNYSGTPRLKSGTNYINYNIGFTSPLLGAGADTNIGGSGAGHLAMNAAIPAGALNDVPAGSYSDTIILTFTY